MVLQMPRPFKHPKTGVYYFRVRVPADLVKVVGKSEVKISLGTKDPSLAKELFTDKEARTLSEWKALRAVPEPIPHKQIVGLAGKLYHQMMATLEDEPGDPVIWENVLRLANEAEASDNLEQWCGASADALLLDEGIGTDPNSRARLLIETHKAFKQFAEQQLKRAEGDCSADPNANRFPTAAIPKPAARITLTDLFDLWKRDHLAEGKAPRTVDDFKQKINDFAAYLGHENAERVTPRNVADYVEHLRHVKLLSARTVHAKYLAAIRTVYRTGIAKIKVTEDPTRPIEVKVLKAVQERPAGFTDAEAIAILKCALNDPSSLGKMSDLNKLEHVRFNPVHIQRPRSSLRIR